MKVKGVKKRIIIKMYCFTLNNEKILLQCPNCIKVMPYNLYIYHCNNCGYNDKCYGCLKMRYSCKCNDNIAFRTRSKNPYNLSYGWV